MNWIARAYTAFNEAAQGLGAAFLRHLDDLLIALGLACATAGFALLHPSAALLFLGAVFVFVGAAVGGRMASAPDDPEEEGET